MLNRCEDVVHICGSIINYTESRNDNAYTVTTESATTTALIIDNSNMPRD